ncbi:MAG TPA: selenide, water dikinase SelD, partial [Niastella sp.]|nr:selenide, water dikinase SelD [Niastella sp.]
ALSNEHHDLMLRQLMQLNKVGEALAAFDSVHAMTDVTGFGLLGHLIEMSEGSRLSAEIQLQKVPLIPGIESYLQQNIKPGGTKRNWASYGHKVHFEPSIDAEAASGILADPQTNGGLLVAVGKDRAGEVEKLLKANGLRHEIIGNMTAKRDKTVYVI